MAVPPAAGFHDAAALYAVPGPSVAHYTVTSASEKATPLYAQVAPTGNADPEPILLAHQDPEAELAEADLFQRGGHQGSFC